MKGLAPRSSYAEAREARVISERVSETSESRVRLSATMASSVTSRGSSRGGEDAVAEARCRAARDKLRVVREAMEAPAPHLQALAADEGEKAAYLARRAPLDATEEARRARSEAASALAAAEQGEKSTGAQAAALDEENVAASRAYEDAVAALGPVPAPPPFRDHLNDARSPRTAPTVRPCFCSPAACSRAPASAAWRC